MYIEDLMLAYWLSYKNEVKGEIFNIGGEKNNILSIFDFIKYLKQKKSLKNQL